MKNAVNHSNMQPTSSCGHELFPVTDQSAMILYKTDDQKIDNETKTNCRILKFPSEYSYSEKFAGISTLDPQNYPNLFMFIIEDKNFEFSNSSKNTRLLDIAILKLCIVNFCRNRQLFLKLTSIDENESKFFIKKENVDEFFEIDVKELMKEIDSKTLKVLAENDEMPMNSETDIYNKLLEILDQPRKLVNGDKIIGSVDDIDMIDSDVNNPITKIMDTTTADDKHQSDQNQEIPHKTAVNDKLEEQIEDNLPEDAINMIKHLNAEDLIVMMIDTHSKKVVELILSEIIQKMTKSCENGFFNYLQHINKDSETIFHLIVKQKDSVNLQIFYEAIKWFLTPQQLKDILCRQTTTKYENILQLATKCDKIEFHEVIWEILINAFESREDLMELIMQKNRFNDNFAHYLVVHDKPDIIEFTINKLQKIFSPTQYQEILKSKGYNDRNLLQAAAVSSKDIKTHQTLWEAFNNTSNSAVEFTEYLTVVDKNDNNIFHLAACFTTKKVFEFMFTVLENLTSHENIKKILTSTGLAGKNLLQSAARQNYSVELHKSLWEINQKFSGNVGLLEIIKHIDDFGDNVLSDVIECNTKEVAAFIWNEVKFFMISANKDFRELNIERFGGRDLLQLALQNFTHPYVHDFCKKMLIEYESLLNASERVYSVERRIDKPSTEYNIASLRQQQKSKLIQKPPSFPRQLK